MYVDDMEIGEILKDFKSIKVPSNIRSYLNKASDIFLSGDLSSKEKIKIRNMCKRYWKQFRTLHESRERATVTNGLRSIGIRKKEVDRAALERRKHIDHIESDVGF